MQAQVKLVAAANGTDTELQIDANNDSIFETVLTLSGTITGNIILTSEGGYTNNVIRIAPVDTSNGPDFVIGSAQGDIINSFGGNDTIVAGDGADSVNAGDDDDLVDGGAGNDTLLGGAGQDTITGGTGNDSIDGGDGNGDTVVLAGSWSGYTITQSGGVYTIVDRDPSNGDEGTDTVSNSERIAFNGSTTTTFAIADAVNDTPVLANALADQNATEGAAFSFSVAANTFSDADTPLGDYLTLSATMADGTPLPTWLSFNAETGTFSGTPGSGDLGALSVKVTATDASNAAISDTFDITVGSANAAPTITSNGGGATARGDGGRERHGGDHGCGH